MSDHYQCHYCEKALPQPDPAAYNFSAYMKPKMVDCENPKCRGRQPYPPQFSIANDYELCRGCGEQRVETKSLEWKARKPGKRPLCGRCAKRLPPRTE